MKTYRALRNHSLKRRSSRVPFQNKMKQTFAKIFGSTAIVALLAAQFSFPSMAAKASTGVAILPPAVAALAHSATVSQLSIHSVYMSGGIQTALPLPVGTVQYAGNGTLIQGSGTEVDSILGATVAVSAASQLSDAGALLLDTGASGAQRTIAVAPPFSQIAINVVVPLVAAGQLHYTSFEPTRTGSTAALAVVEQQLDLPQPELHIFAARSFTGIAARKAPRPQAFRSALTLNLLC